MNPLGPDPSTSSVGPGHISFSCIFWAGARTTQQAINPMALPEDLISLEDCAEDAGPYISEDHSLVKNKLKTQHHKKNQEMLLHKGEG